MVALGGLPMQHRGYGRNIEMNTVICHRLECL
jgi:hypothetical protein